MKTAGVKELKNRLSEFIRDVRRGETILVTDRGEVVAQLAPVGPGADVADTADERTLRRLMASGWLQPPMSDESEPFPDPPSEGLSRELFDEIWEDIRSDRT